jgi:hypothetical protein
MKLSPTQKRACRRSTVVATACLLLAGCTHWNWRGEGYGADAPQWSENLRKPSGPAGSNTGLDMRAVEIERNLGVH